MAEGSAAQAVNGFNGAKSNWEVGTPSNQENNGHLSKNRALNSGSSRKPLTNAANGAPISRKSSRDASDSHLLPNRVGELGKVRHSLSRTGSEADSLLDLYGNSSGNSAVNVTSPVDDDRVPENMYQPEEYDQEERKWIHRDKLLKIESEELQAAGITLPNTRRTTSKTGRRTQSRERSGGAISTEPGDKHGSVRDEKKQRIASPVNEEDDDPKNWDLRTPEEIAAEENAKATNIYSNPALRKSGSRIPVFTSSPIPVPSNTRKRTISGSQDGDFTGTRSRGNSVGSQILLDDGQRLNTPPSSIGRAGGAKLLAQTSPSKARASPTVASTNSTPTGLRKAGPTGAGGAPPTTAAARKTSTQHKRVPSVTKQGSPAQAQRPSTRSGEGDRPRTAVNRPEGDPPWLATMYRPDPSLPPDQQIIPTHAKKQLQDKWTEDGSIPTTYDRDFGPLAIHTGDGLQKVGDKREDENAWPLKPLHSVTSASTGRPGTSGSGTAGYSTMPKVSSPLSPPLGVRIPSPRVSTIPVSRIQQPIPPDSLSKGKEKSCGCCVVM